MECVSFSTNELHRKKKTLTIKNLVGRKSWSESHVKEAIYLTVCMVVLLLLLLLIIILGCSKIIEIEIHILNENVCRKTSQWEF